MVWLDFEKRESENNKVTGVRAQQGSEYDDFLEERPRQPVLGPAIIVLHVALIMGSLTCASTTPTF